MHKAKIFMATPYNQQLNPLTVTDYIAEEQLQSFLARYPDLLPGDQISPEAPRRWLLVAREMGVPGTVGESGRWSLDHLFLDQDGIPTFVECKRAVDTRARREVVAQMLDYAANGLFYWDISRLRQAAADTAQARGAAIEDLVVNLIDGVDYEDVQEYWIRVEENLRNGKVRLIFVLDEAPKELRRLIEFLNTQMADVEVLAVEIKQFVAEGHTVLTPRVVGPSELARAQKAEQAQRKQTLTRDEFLQRCSPVVAPIFTQMLDMATAKGYIIRWNPASFAIRAVSPVDRRHLSFIHVWLPTERFSFYFNELRLSPEQAVAVRQELLDTHLFRESGGKTLEAERLSAANAPQILAAYQMILDKIAELTQHQSKEPIEW